jgi:hypothetical protein
MIFPFQQIRDWPLHPIQRPLRVVPPGAKKQIIHFSSQRSLWVCGALLPFSCTLLLPGAQYDFHSFFPRQIMTNAASRFSLREAHRKWKWSRSDAKKQRTFRNTKHYFPSPAASNTNGLLFVSSHRGEEATAVEIAEGKEIVSNEGRTQYTRLLCITSAIFSANESTCSGYRVCRLTSAESNHLAQLVMQVEDVSRNWGTLRWLASQQIV